MNIDLCDATIDDAITALQQLKIKLGINQQLLIKTKIYLTFKIGKKTVNFHNINNKQADHLIFRDGSLFCVHEALVPEPKMPWYVSLDPNPKKALLEIPEAVPTLRERKRIQKKEYDAEMEEFRRQQSLREQKTWEIKREKAEEKRKNKKLLDSAQEDI